MLCSELNHTRGDNVRGCLMCSMPVCEACIIKESFGKRDEKTFQHRTRTLCSDCYDSETPHIEQTFKSGMKGKNAVLPTCICTPKEGHLCLRCKSEQRSQLAVKLARCYGQDCTRTQAGGFPGRVCLWCDLRLPGNRSRAEARRDYDARHLLARSHSTYEHPVDEQREQREQIWLMEHERLRELDNLSERRRDTAETAEDARWAQTEALRRFDSMFYPPPPVIRQRAGCTVESIKRQHCMASSSTLVGGDQSPLPSYESALFSTGTAVEGNQEGYESSLFSTDTAVEGSQGGYESSLFSTDTAVDGSQESSDSNTSDLGQYNSITRGPRNPL